MGLAGAECQGVSSVAVSSRDFGAEEQYELRGTLGR